MRDAASGLGRIRAEDSHSALVAAGLPDTGWPQKTPPPAAQDARTGERSGNEQQGVAAEWDAASALPALYHAHYASLVRVAVLLVGDLARAQKVVEDSFVAMHAHWRRLDDQDTALEFLRRRVIKRSRSAFHRRGTGDLAAPSPAVGTRNGAESAIIAALRALSRQEREVLVLGYYAELPDAQIASVMGISQRAVQSHTDRAMSALRGVLGRES
jgi:DNA-directed RNA polymerase specialized sigma24 family protein